MEQPALTIRVVCSSGTYIRALARDLGQRLGCGAHVIALTRLACRPFTLEESITLEELTRIVSEGRLDEVMLPLDSAVADWPPLILDEEAAGRIVHGQPVAGTMPGQKETRMGKGKWARVYSAEGEFLAIARWNQDEGSWRPHKVFA